MCGWKIVFVPRVSESAPSRLPSCDPLDLLNLPHASNDDHRARRPRAPDTAEVRALRAMKFGGVDHPGYLRQRSIRPESEKRYKLGHSIVMRSAADCRMNTTTDETADKLFEKIADAVYFKGLGLGDFRHVVWGFAWVEVRAVPKARCRKRASRAPTLPSRAGAWHRQRRCATL